MPASAREPRIQGPTELQPGIPGAAFRSLKSARRIGFRRGGWRHGQLARKLRVGEIIAERVAEMRKRLLQLSIRRLEITGFAQQSGQKEVTDARETRVRVLAL